MNQARITGLLTELENGDYRPDGSWSECEDRNAITLKGKPSDLAKMWTRCKMNPDLDTVFRLATYLGVPLFTGNSFRISRNMGFYADIDIHASDEEIIDFLI